MYCCDTVRYIVLPPFFFSNTNLLYYSSLLGRRLKETRKEEGRVAVASRPAACKKAELAKVADAEAAKAIKAAKSAQGCFILVWVYQTLPVTRYITTASLCILYTR